MTMISSSQVPAVQPRRKITGMSAILLPMTDAGEVDWVGFERHVARTFDLGLAPAVNMDTGYANLIAEATREEALRRTNAIAAGRQYVAGAFVHDEMGSSVKLDNYKVAIEQIQKHAGVPVLFQSFGLTALSDEALVSAYRELGASCDKFIFFELGKMFAPFGAIYSLAVYEQLVQIPSAIGAKHSSLRREPEWQRLELRDRIRPEFMVLTGNDLAIDMVMYGSDYLLGLSTFAPDAFARRDQLWLEGDPRFYELNDLLQYLGWFVFRSPTPAYKHSAAMFLTLRGWIDSDATHPNSPGRPASDRDVLELILSDLNRLMEESNG